MHQCQYSHAPSAVSVPDSFSPELVGCQCQLVMLTLQVQDSFFLSTLTDHLCDLCPVFPVYFAFYANFDQILTHLHIKCSSCVRIKMLSASDESLTDKSELFFLGLQV